MNQLVTFFKAHAKAISAFISAEATAVITVLSTTNPSKETWIIALLGPIAVGGTVHKVSNTP